MSSKFIDEICVSKQLITNVLIIERAFTKILDFGGESLVINSF